MRRSEDFLQVWSGLYKKLSCKMKDLETESVNKLTNKTRSKRQENVGKCELRATEVVI